MQQRLCWAARELLIQTSLDYWVVGQEWCSCWLALILPCCRQAIQKWAEELKLHWEAGAGVEVVEVVEDCFVGLEDQ